MAVVITGRWPVYPEGGLVLGTLARDCAGEIIFTAGEGEKYFPSPAARIDFLVAEEAARHSGRRRSRLGDKFPPPQREVDDYSYYSYEEDPKPRRVRKQTRENTGDGR